MVEVSRELTEYKEMKDKLAPVLQQSFEGNLRCGPNTETKMEKAAYKSKNRVSNRSKGSYKGRSIKERQFW